MKNSSSTQRHEVIEIDAHRITPILGSEIVVRDASGIEQPSQITHDGKFLIYVSVRPKGEANYTLHKGKTALHERYVGGRQYPERADDLSFENDKIGFRLYGPATKKKGEKAYGQDVWVKRAPALMLDSIYALNFSKNNEMDRLRKEGKKREADSLGTATSYHLDHGLGMDCYAVGPTLGCGTPALMRGGQLLFPWCYEEYEILDNGPLRFTALLHFGEMHGAREHRLITADRGSHFFRTTVWYDDLRQASSLAAGFVMRPADTESLTMGKNYAAYADPTMYPDKHNSQIFVAVAFPNGVNTISKLPSTDSGNAGHVVGIVRQYQGKPYTYYFGAAWSDYDIRTFEEWQLHVTQFLRQREMPLTIVCR
ncbi:MAG: DUF4861 domain-containing protein [Bacteroidaceae bacterium]|nr:DUF4861 domain-containing protein [Bacteroidaceae bacterium]